MRKALVTLLLGSPLVVLPLSAALGNESAPDKRSEGVRSHALPLRPVPYLDTMQWLNRQSDDRKRPNVLSPDLENPSPFLIDTKIPPTRFSAGGRVFD